MAPKPPKAHVTRELRYAPVPQQVFEEIQKFFKFDAIGRKDTSISDLGNMITTYKRSKDGRETTIALTDSRVEVIIKCHYNCKFDGHILSFDEFKLIWDRIL